MNTALDGMYMMEEPFGTCSPKRVSADVSVINVSGLKLSVRILRTPLESVDTLEILKGLVPFHPVPVQTTNNPRDPVLGISPLPCTTFGKIFVCGTL